jgi:predicted nucleic acid-binding Zn ribbon protein
MMNNPFGTAICPVCGKEFSKTKYNNTLCSDDCKRIYENRRRVEMRKKRMPVVKCIICGEEFKQNHGAQKCCSTECAKKNHDLYNKDYRKTKAQNKKQVESKPKTKSPNSRKSSKKKIIIDKFQEVIDAQRGPIEELYAKSRKWTKEQIAFAKERYRKIYLGQ